MSERASLPDLLGPHGLAGRLAVVAGGGRGIGRATALGLAELGARVAVLARREETAQATAGAIRENGGEAWAFAADVGDYTAVQQVAGHIRAHLGPARILVQAAGDVTYRLFAEESPGDWSRSLRVNLFGAIHCAHAFLPGMAAAGGGSVVFLGSDAGATGIKGQAVYSAGKAGLEAFARSLAREYAAAGIRVNTVCPGLTETDLLHQTAAASGSPDYISRILRRVPLGRTASPWEVARVVLFLCSDAASYVTGQTWRADGGLHISS